MALFDYRCDHHGDFEVRGSAGAAPKWSRCPQCNRWSGRVFIAAPYFQEDRQRFFRNHVDGSNFSYTLGKTMPDTVRGYARELDKIGAEPITSKRDMPEPMRANLEYREHVSTGGERIADFEKARHPATSKGTLTVSEQLRKSGVRVG